MNLKSIVLVSLSLTLNVLTYGAESGDMKVSADEGLKRLHEGNSRFVAGKSMHPNKSLERVEYTGKNGQRPFASVLACADSRQAVETVFDQGIGDLFVVRVAGNVASEDEVGSIEFSTGNLGAPLIVVLGHTHCGAVSAAAQRAKVGGNLKKLIRKIEPAVDQTRMEYPKLEGDEFTAMAIKSNVYQSIESLMKSASIRKAVESKKVKIVGAIYNIETGEVEWLGEHPMQSKMMAKGKVAKK